MITNELMRQLLTDLPDDDRRHLVEVVDRNHAEQLARKRRARAEPGLGEVADTEVLHDWDDDSD
jgi:hypothetical protein